MNEDRTTAVRKAKTLEEFGLSNREPLRVNTRLDGYATLPSRSVRRKGSRERKRLVLTKGVLPVILLACIALASCGTMNVHDAAQLGSDAGAIYSEIQRDPETVAEQAGILIGAARFVQGSGDQTEILQALISLAGRELDISDRSLAILTDWTIQASREIITDTDREALVAFLVEAANSMIDSVAVRQAERKAVNGRIDVLITNAEERLQALAE